MAEVRWLEDVTGHHKYHVDGIYCGYVSSADRDIMTSRNEYRKPWRARARPRAKAPAGVRPIVDEFFDTKEEAMAWAVAFALMT